MSRKIRKSQRRYIEPDTRYQSVKITKFINYLMIGGKKTISEKIVYVALENLSKSVGKPVQEAFDIVLMNVTPKLEVRSRRVGGSTYQVPHEIRPDRGFSLALRWIIGFCRSKKGVSMVDGLSTELIDAYNKTGRSIKKREDTHKMAESNKAFSHFRF